MRGYSYYAVTGPSSLSVHVMCQILRNCLGVDICQLFILGKSIYPSPLQFDLPCYLVHLINQQLPSYFCFKESRGLWEVFCRFGEVGGRSIKLEDCAVLSWHPHSNYPTHKSGKKKKTMFDTGNELP